MSEERREAEQCEHVGWVGRSCQKCGERLLPEDATPAAPAPVGAAPAPPAEEEGWCESCMAGRHGTSCAGYIIGGGGCGCPCGADRSTWPHERPAAPVVAAAPEEGERCETCGLANDPGQKVCAWCARPRPVAVSEHDTDPPYDEALRALVHHEHASADATGFGPCCIDAVLDVVVPEGHVVVPVGVTQLADGTRWEVELDQAAKTAADLGVVTHRLAPRRAASPCCGSRRRGARRWVTT